MESFFRSLKAELAHGRFFTSDAQMTAQIGSAEQPTGQSAFHDVGRVAGRRLLRLHQENLLVRNDRPLNRGMLRCGGPQVIHRKKYAV